LQSDPGQRPVPGTLYGVGLGPGDPELMTLKAARVVGRVKVLAVPVKAEGAESFARSIVADHLRPDHTVLELVFPMRSDPDFLRPYWERAAERLAEHLKAGRDAAFLCEGDPFTYGTFVHVFTHLTRAHPELPVQVVPGVSAYHAAAAAVLTPLAATDDRVAVLPATYGVDVVAQVLARFDTVVLLKVKPVMDALLDLLERKGLTPHAVFVNRVGAEGEELVRDVATLRGRKLEYLSLLLVKNPHRAREPVLKGCRPKGDARPVAREAG
jgi:precorrin-2/cobalt-factor-2 C20-methyltransferase